jgi:CheY-like chemotaxis protein
MTTMAQASVLIIDDQHAARSLLKKLLKDMGVDQVFEAATGRDALALVEGAPDMVDIIFCDWNMPQMSGIEFIRRMRAGGASIPVVMTTGRADRESVLEARKIGISGYLAKPFSRAQLEAKIRIALTRKTAEAS